MKQSFAFLRDTLLAGVLLVLPAWLAVLLLLKAVTHLRVIVKPVTAKLPEGVDHPGVVALLLLIAVCFLVGVSIRTVLGARMRCFVENRVLNKLPGYSTLRGFTAQLTKLETTTAFQSALIEVEDALVPGFFVEEHPNGRCTVFVPSVPTPMTGSLYVLANSRVHRLNVPTMAIINCISKWGAGSSALVAALDAASVLPAQQRIAKVPSLVGD